ncbi:MAG: hypothetical protein J0H07_05890 [Sphingobacteriales bacterium]|nr:hypothetical protein [Sphingobacteriales bacterium]
MAKELTWDKIKSSLDNDYRKKVFNDPPMLHLKVAIPPWATDKKEKFNINWEHNEWLTKCDTTNIS